MFFALLHFALLTALDTKAVQEGIDRSAATRLPFVLPAGVHTVVTIHLPSNSHLQFAAGAILRMTPLNGDYAPPEHLNYEPFADSETSLFEHALLFASDANNIVIDGPGRIECNRGERGGPKPISIRRSTNIRIEGITIDQAPNYAVSLIDSRFIDIGGITITRAHADGIDLDGVRDARVHDCDIESEDDAIALKSSASLQRKLLSNNILVENCRLKSASVFFKIGPESYGDFSKIQVRDLILTGGMGNRHGNPGIALETVDGGTIRDVKIERITMDRVGTPIFLRVGERRGAPNAPSAGDMYRIQFRDIKARGARYPSVIAGLAENPIVSLDFERIDIEPVPAPLALDPRQAVPETRSAYPEPTQFGSLPASVFFIRNVRRLSFGVLQYAAVPAAPAILLERVSGNWPGCDPIEPNRWACSGTHPSQRPGSATRLREKRSR